MFKPRYTITNQLLQNIKEITRLITTLESSCFSDIVLYDMEQASRELSVFSSTSIEGNPLPLTEVKKLLKNKPEHLSDSEKEIHNYNQALTYVHDSLTQKRVEFDRSFICSVQERIMSGLLEKHRTGKIRKEPVFVNDPRTGNPVYLPPDHTDVQSLMVDLVQFLSVNKNVVDPLILAGLFHKQFVIIHPFVDGNGRTVRLLTTALLADAGFSMLKLFSFENYYNQNVTSYFKHVGVFGNYYDMKDDITFTPWLEYFTGGIIDELMRVKKELETRGMVPENNLRDHDRLILDYIGKHGFISDKDYASLTSRAKATRTLDFKRLIELNHIKRQGKGKNTYYIFK